MMITKTEVGNDKGGVKRDDDVDDDGDDNRVAIKIMMGMPAMRDAGVELRCL